MNYRKLKVLLIVEQCNPEWASVPLEGYNYYHEISQRADVTLVTHERNKSALEKTANNENIIYITEAKWVEHYYNIVSKITASGRINWPLQHALTYPIYAQFNHRVYQQFKQQVKEQHYDVVHAITPMMPRYPAKIVRACQNTPFILGPVNGGVPFPAGFKTIAKQEFVQYNFLKKIGRNLIPGYVETYRKADKILAGSSYTLKMLQKIFNLPKHKIDLFYENGITANFLTKYPKEISKNDKVNLLFVGRLVPYKGADMLIEAIAQLKESDRAKIRLNIVGDGSEKSDLQQRVEKFNLSNIVNFVGWVQQGETLEYYRRSDIFCFPSIREFGGAVVLEAMASGLPCIVVNNGGIGEYVTETNGFKIEPISREHIVRELGNKIEYLLENKDILKQMSSESIARAKEFEWGVKAEKIAAIYQDVIAEKQHLKVIEQPSFA
ncbi:glycosyltransferase family 4 protein [Waterburya agarophytonicola K14]|uniref:Glycosyltransferase family 4 protein n=1 Tax=Waterburya agarophytonicola KI4 TaxID=2874699 RepID=A0A964BPV7_9CYAN|nr:glycosyltransferase family 4 protein [Waterburya agarophytonicola]MCC0176147.1 glycosyltransferase family 4 protein [Waterburya agarophytonicola KI4]